MTGKPIGSEATLTALLRRDRWTDYLSLSPDGRHLAFMERSAETRAWVLTVLRIEDREQWTALELPREEGRVYFQDWTADGRYLVYTTGVNQDGRPGAWVWRVPFEGRGFPLCTELQLGLANWIKISAKGNHFAFMGADESKAPSGPVWVLENFLPPS